MKTRSIRPRPFRSSLTSITDTARFFLAWVRDPRGVAAIAPSSRALAALITSGIDSNTGPVLELGAGTGSFTQALTTNGVAEEDLTLVESEAPFAELLRRRYPRATVFQMDAADLGDLAAGASDRFGATVCGLGFLNQGEQTVETILRGAFARMRPGAALFLFTYGRRCSFPDEVLAQLDLTAERIGTTLRNVPPASVYRLSCLPGHGR